MDSALRPFFEKVRDLYDEAAFAAKLDALREQFGGLLDDEALALYVLDEHGRNEGAVVTVADARGRAEATVDVVVDRALDVREFARGEGIGRVLNVVVRDAKRGTEARLTLWDRDVDRAFDGTLRPGARVRVVNARVKDSRFGLELHVTPWTRLEVEGALDPARAKLLADVRPDFDPTGAPPTVAPPPAEAAAQPPAALPPVGQPPAAPQRSAPPAAPAAPAAPAPTAPARARQATLGESLAARPALGGPEAAPAGRAEAAAEARTMIEPERLADARPGDTVHLARFVVRRVRPTRTFRRQDGTVGFVAEVDVEDESGAATITLWDDAVKAARALAPGARAQATDLAAKERGGRVELHSTRATRLGVVP